MKGIDVIDAMSHIDDDLIVDAKQPRRSAPAGFGLFPLRPACAAPFWPAALRFTSAAYDS